MEDQIPTTPAPTTGVRTSEGAAALITISAPVVAALAKLEGWQLIAALGIAASVAIAYGGFRTWLKAKGVAALVVLALLLAPSCATVQVAKGHYEVIPPDPQACADALLRAAAAQAPCDRSPPPPTAEIVACAAAAAAEMRPCAPVFQWVPDLVAAK